MSKHTNPESIREMFTRHDSADDLNAAHSALSHEGAQAAFAWLWGTMTVRDPEACIEALAYGREREALIDSLNTEQANDRS